jgi:hypothetical protein
VALRLAAKKENDKGRVNVYLGLPKSLGAPLKMAIAQSGVNAAFILRDAIPTYLEGGIDSETLKDWDLLGEAPRSDIYTSIPHDLHDKCVEISTREGVSLAAVFRAALAHVFEVEPQKLAKIR